jgi:glycosyltransferase involved in cell wall biosynthesis
MNKKGVKNMFFTLIIPAYNCEKTIDRLLNSVIE